MYVWKREEKKNNKFLRLHSNVANIIEITNENPFFQTIKQKKLTPFKSS